MQGRVLFGWVTWSDLRNESTPTAVQLTAAGRKRVILWAEGGFEEAVRQEKEKWMGLGNGDNRKSSYWLTRSWQRKKHWERITMTPSNISGLSTQIQTDPVYWRSHSPAPESRRLTEEGEEAQSVFHWVISFSMNSTTDKERCKLTSSQYHLLPLNSS